ncbi:MAG TPA: tetratricopeptide repeat protein [Rubellimicrobium sp.]|nr:tetratricopeptide repeat protein [Rubellimicrobium sp.]
MRVMGSRPPAFKSVVAAFLAALLLATPLAAQQTDGEREADLLRQLAEAGDPQAALMIEGELRGMWSRSGSAAIDLLLRRGRDAIEAGAPEEAVEHFTAALDWDPEFAEAYVGRAQAYYLTNHVGPAIDDLRQALLLNPNQWEALMGFAAVLEEVGLEEDALELWHRVHDMHPQNPEASAAVDRLELQLQGRTL